MKKIAANEAAAYSADILSENIAQLSALFPEAFTEGKIDFEVLKQLLGGAVDEREEKYGLNWHGKRRARQLALTPSTGTLRPCPDDSVDWDTTQNLMIEGDNLEVLKLLQESAMHSGVDGRGIPPALRVTKVVPWYVRKPIGVDITKPLLVMKGYKPPLPADEEAARKAELDKQVEDFFSDNTIFKQIEERKKRMLQKAVQDWDLPTN